MTFLPENYKEPETSNYMRFKEGENTFRILSDAIIGWKWWIDNKNGNRKPIRVKTEDEIVLGEIDDPQKIKHFWAFVVYNFDAEKIQILEITQATVRKPIKALSQNTKWGDPKNYNIVVVKTGEGMDTEYQVTPEPKEKLNSEIIKKYENMEINLDALFEDEDPFAVKEDKIDLDDISL